VAVPYHYHNGEYLQITELGYLLGGVVTPDKFWRMRMYPAGGLYSTVVDLSHFFIAHMNGGVWNGVRILEADTVAEMHRIQPPGSLDENTGHYYGLGWTVMPQPLNLAVNLSGHGGGYWGVHTWMYYLVSENIGVIYFVNGDKSYEQNEIFRLLSGLIPIISLYKKGGFTPFFPFD
jgi:CubicO group peptidase (beta-lactamase class C family)